LTWLVSLPTCYELIRITPIAIALRSFGENFKRAFSANFFVLNGFDKAVNSPSMYLKSSHCSMVFGISDLCHE
jgi:hypothetical protein